MARGKRTPEAMKAMREAKAKAQTQRRATQEALAPLRDRVRALIEAYERTVPFEHARRMNKLLHSVVRAAEIALEEAEKDLAGIILWSPITSFTEDSLDWVPLLSKTLLEFWERYDLILGRYHPSMSLIEKQDHAFFTTFAG